jgi:hypothetical protein
MTDHNHSTPGFWRSIEGSTVSCSIIFIPPGLDRRYLGIRDDDARAYLQIGGWTKDGAMDVFLVTVDDFLMLLPLANPSPADQPRPERGP